MSVYTQYVNNFSNSIDALDCERKRSKAFNNFLQVHSRFALCRAAGVSNATSAGRHSRLLIVL